MKDYDDDKKQIKENFCPSCLVMPLAFVGTGAVVASEQMSNKHKRWKKALVITGAVTLVSLVLMLIWYYALKKGCNSGVCAL